MLFINDCMSIARVFIFTPNYKTMRKFDEKTILVCWTLRNDDGIPSVKENIHIYYVNIYVSQRVTVQLKFTDASLVKKS